MIFLEHLSALAEPTRARLLRTLEDHDLTVSELCSVLQLPQSTVSRHLKVLADGGWVRFRPDGARRLYRLASDDLDPHARELWQLTRKQVAASSAAEEDARRLSSVVERRRSRSREFFAGAAGEWDHLREALFGTRVLSMSLLGLLSRDRVVADLGCGTGTVSAALAPFVSRVVAVDGSEPMLEAARTRLHGADNVDLRLGELESIPIGDDEVHAATLILVLHHLPHPETVLAEAARIVAPGGKLLILDMLPHDRDEYREEMGHVWSGFSEERLRGWLDAAGLALELFAPVPPDPDARGPGLFVATALQAA